MKRPTPDRLRDILEAGDAVAQLRPTTFEVLESDFTSQLALTRLVEIIGEASNRVSESVRDLHPDIPWREIIAMRHHITHGYFDIDLRLLWEVVVDDLPSVLPKIRVVLAELSEEDTAPE